MATKAQLKQYFETGKIPTQAQFGELIDFVQPLISDNVSDRPNQTLLFGGDTPNPIINGLRIIHYYENDDNIHNYWIFTNEAGGNNQSGISIPMFVIKSVSSEEPNLSLDMPYLKYAIPTREQLTNWVRQGYDCDTADAGTLHSALTYLTFKPWPEGGGSEFPRVAYINSQSAWDTWYNSFKTAHPESGNSGGSGSPILNQRVIDGYTFIIETSDKINFYSNESLEFVNCTIINNDTTEGLISMNFTNCVFRNCHIDSGYRVTGGQFECCTVNIDGNINNATLHCCKLYGYGSTYNCVIRISNVSISVIESGKLSSCYTIDSTLNDSVEIDMGVLNGCHIQSSKFTNNRVTMLYCEASDKNAFTGSAHVIQGFIYGCDFSRVEAFPGVLIGAQCCKFKSTLLSSGVIMADLFGNKNAATNGMNTGV